MNSRLAKVRGRTGLLAAESSPTLKRKSHSTGVPLVTPVVENNFRGFGFVAS
jgi:hypothetical protein